jgi:hypothetical protein
MRLQSHHLIFGCMTANVLACEGWQHNDECPLRLVGEETAQHLLIGCNLVKQIGCIIFPISGLPPARWIEDTRGMNAKTMSNRPLISLLRIT